MKKLVSLSIITGLILIFNVQSFFAQNATEETVKSVKKVEESPKQKTVSDKNQTPASALLYKITGNNAKPSYIFGTVHIICPNDLFSQDNLKTYLSQTEQMFLELDLDDPKEMEQLMKGSVLSNGKTLQDILSKEQYAKVDEAFKQVLGIGVEPFKSYSPFFLQVVLTTVPKATGCQAPTAYDMELVKMATEKKMPINGFETATEQFGFINSLPLEKHVEGLLRISANPQAGIDSFKKMMQVYKAQNSDELYNLIFEQSANEREFYNLMLDARNKNWIPKIEKAIAEKPTFIGVGGGHLGGENGVLNLLKKKGYKIEAIKL